MKMNKLIFSLILLLACIRLNAQNLYVNNDDGTTLSYSIEDVRRITIEQPNLVVLLFNGDSFSFPLSEVSNYQYNEGALNLDNTLEIINNWNINLYPNPADDQFTVSFYLKEPSSIKYTIADLNGKVISNNDLGIQKEGGHEFIVSATNLASGTYLFNFYKNGSVYYKKIIKN